MIASFSCLIKLLLFSSTEDTDFSSPTNGANVELEKTSFRGCELRVVVEVDWQIVSNCGWEQVSRRGRGKLVSWGSDGVGDSSGECVVITGDGGGISNRKGVGNLSGKRGGI